MNDYLSKIIHQKKQEVERLRHDKTLNEILARSYSQRRRFSNALQQPGLSVIAEIKRQSPSVGNIAHIEDPAQLALKYSEGGASAISVLTDSTHFGGSLDDLTRVSQTVQMPTLRKDFIIHPIQLAEAVVAGASAVLLIARAAGKHLSVLIHEAERLGLEVLTEVHDEADLELALEANAPIIGINHRNLTTFAIDLTISETLKPLIPSNVITVAESGILHANHAKRMRELAFDAILVGEALVRSQNPAHLIQQMKGSTHEG